MVGTYFLISLLAITVHPFERHCTLHCFCTFHLTRNVWLQFLSVNNLSLALIEMPYHVYRSGNSCHGVLSLNQSDFLHLVFDNLHRKAFWELPFYVSSDKMKGIWQNSFDRQHHRELVFMFMIVILSSWGNIFSSLNRIPYQSLWNKLHSRGR